jgi:hypothetical protein
MIEVLDIVAIQNDEVLPPKEKYHVCIHEEWFFVINSNARKMYDPHLKIQQLDYTFLRQDSYICCSRIFSFSQPKYRKLGILSPSTAQDIIQTVESALTLTLEEKDDIKKSLSNRINE